jgi:HAMP domain-containing protein
MDGTRERRHPDRRRSILVHSRVQGIPALLFFLLVAASAALFGAVFLREALPPLKSACTMGHYCPTFSAMELLAPLVLRDVAVLTFSLLLSGTVLLMFLSERVTAGIRKVCESLRRHALGDLSTPTEGARFPGTDDLARTVDRGALMTLDRIRAIREEAESLASLPPAGDDFDRRLAALERSLREVVR